MHSPYSQLKKHKALVREIGPRLTLTQPSYT